jgi:hypothetical protein
LVSISVILVQHLWNRSPLPQKKKIMKKLLKKNYENVCGIYDSPTYNSLGFKIIPTFCRQACLHCRLPHFTPDFDKKRR